MNIKIHRGTHQIGGCVTEYEYEGWHLFVDYGEELPGEPQTGLHQIEHLTHGDLSKSALLITHYHGDHIACITKLPKELPIYIGKVGREIKQVLSGHLKSVDGVHQEMIDRLQDSKTFEAGWQFEIGPFKIMPVTIDHSAFDAYAFKIEAGGVNAFHTGDFRTHGFRSGKLQKVIEKYVGHVDYLVCEATNVMRPDATSLSESDLQKQFEEKFRGYKNNIVYLSSTNIDRLFALYHAALRAGLPFYVDAYQKRIMDVVAKGDSIWTKSKLYRYGKYEPSELIREENGFVVNDHFKDFLSKKGYVLIARANDAFNDLIERLPGEKHKYLSMWRGYLDKKNKVAYNEKLAGTLAEGYEYMHTSGHCDMDSLRDFFRLFKPKTIIPIHTDNPEAFSELFCGEWPVTVLNDGEYISPISNRVADACNAGIYYLPNLPRENWESTMVSKEDNESFCHLGFLNIGYFQTREDAKNILAHTRYQPNDIIGYEISAEEDSAPSIVESYDKELKTLTVYTFGGHQPGGKKYQEACPFAVGQKVLAVFHAPYEAIVPCKIVGPITPETELEYWELNDTKEYYSTYEEYLNDWDDWQWDSVAVHPLVKLKSGGWGDQMTDTVTVPRVYLFPYQSLRQEK